MTRALVIKQYGDPQMCAAIVDGINRQITPMNKSEMEVVMAELTKLRAKDGIRSYGDSKRFRSFQRRMAKKYTTKPTNKLTGAFLSVWGLLWYSVYMLYDFLRAWNRES